MNFISPIIWLIQSLYQFNFSSSGNYGLSLVLLSLEITLITLPLFFLAEKWKRAEQISQSKMENEITDIKASYSGQKRFYLIKEIHKFSNYKSIYSLRVSMGLLIQIPFFMGAFIYLSHFEAFRGISFGPIQDLSTPDGLFRGINILPILMTVVNIITSVIYLRGSKFSEKVQLLIISILFLILLYQRPASLVLYWTINNIFALPRNLWFKKIFPPIKVSLSSTNINIKTLIKNYSREVLFISFFIIFLINCYWIDHSLNTIKYSVMLNFGTSSLISIILFFKCYIKKQFKEMIPIVLLWGFFVFMIYDWYRLSLGTQSFISIEMQRVLVISSSLLILLYSLLKLTESNTIKSENYSIHRISFILFSIFLCTYFFIINPILTFVSSPSEVGIPLFELVKENFISYILFLFVLIFAGKKLSPKKVGCGSFSLIFITLLLITYAYIIDTNYGTLDGAILSKVHFDNHMFKYYLIDLFLLPLLFLLAKIIHTKWLKQSSIIIVIIFVGLLSQTFYQAVSAEKVVQVDQSIIPRLPDNNSVIHGFSKSGENTILIIADAAVAGYFEKLINNEDSLPDELDGFFWYKNTASIGYSTITSMSSILGGIEYSPTNLNNASGTNLRKRSSIYEPYFLEEFNNGTSVSFVNPFTYNNNADIGEIPTTSNLPYCNLWLNENSIIIDTQPKEKGLVLLMLGIFKSSPFMLKQSIYGKGNWVFTNNNNSSFNRYYRALKEWTYLTLLPKISNSSQEGDTLKYIHTRLTHPPYAVNESGVLISEGIVDKESNSFSSGNSHYYSLKEFFRLFSSWIQWLKDEGIYDNTKIVLVSDHGTPLKGENPLSFNLEGATFNHEEFNLANSILMVKDFDSRGKLKIDNRLMSNSDAFYLMRNDVSEYLESLPIKRSVTFSINVGESFNREKDSGTIDYKTWEITNSIFKAQNWSGPFYE